MADDNENPTDDQPAVRLVAAERGATPRLGLAAATTATLAQSHLVCAKKGAPSGGAADRDGWCGLAQSKALWQALLIGALLLSCARTRTPVVADTYSNYADLSRHEAEGADYTVTVVDRHAEVTVLAIHGGQIDVDTHTIAEDLASTDWNLYVFKGIKPSGNWRLHITSNNFDEPRALALAARSRRCLSVHGYRDDTPRICVGGADAPLRERVVEALTTAALPFRTDALCPGLEGTAPRNVANRCAEGGVQLEISSRLRETLRSDASLRLKTMDAIRNGMRSGLATTPTP